MPTIGKVTLQADENGLVTLQCNRCKSRFKMDCAYLNDELQGKEVCCPVCGISEALHTFWPEEAAKIAMAETKEMIINAFKGLNSKYIKVKSSPVSKVNTELTFKNRDYDMQQVTMNCCNKRIALMPKDITAGFYCPYCGRIVK